MNPGAARRSSGASSGRALEKDRNLRYQTATDLKTDLMRLKRDIDSGGRRAAELHDSRPGGPAKPAEKSVAVLYFENLSGVKEDEYLRDGVTEDIITELSKIKGLKIFSRPTVLALPGQAGHRRADRPAAQGRLRAGGEPAPGGQPAPDHRAARGRADGLPVWSERYDREMADVFEVQDEIARKIAEALRVQLSPQEQEALAAQPTENLQAYDLYLRGKSYARRLTRQDLEFALQMFENAVSLDPRFALAHAAIANSCALYHQHFDRAPQWIERAGRRARRPAPPAATPPRSWSRRPGSSTPRGSTTEAVRRVRQAIERKADAEGAYYLLGRALFAAGQYQEVVDLAESARRRLAARTTTSTCRSTTRSARSGRRTPFATRVLQRIQVLETHLRKFPEDARARTLLASGLRERGAVEDAAREASLAMALRPNDAMVLYNVACVFWQLGKKPETLDALRKAWDAGFRDPDWARRDPDLALLHGDPEFEKLYPPGAGSS